MIRGLMSLSRTERQENQESSRRNTWLVQTAESPVFVKPLESSWKGLPGMKHSSQRISPASPSTSIKSAEQILLSIQNIGLLSPKLVDLILPGESPLVSRRD